MIFKQTFLATCILVGCGVLDVNAAPFSIAIGAATGADGSLGFTLTGDTRSGTASLSYAETEQTADLLNFISTTFDDPSATVGRSNVTTFTDGLGFVTNSVDFAVSDPLLAYTVTSDSGASELRSGYSLNFTVFQQLAPDGTVIQYESSSSHTVLGSIYFAADAVATATGAALSPVPLPASAPLFGTALLALGTAGYRARRRTATAA